MPHYMEVDRAPGAELVVLHGPRMTLGRHPDNAIVLGPDHVSRVHAVLEDYGPGWCLKDVGSRNGTFVNGERLWGERILQEGDEVRIGNIRMRFRASRREDAVTTSGRTCPPVLTRREREVLVALCRPVFIGEVFPAPASTRSIARELSVTEDAVKQHLMHLYDKFRIDECDEGRRVRLAKEAIDSGSVSRADVVKGASP